MLGQPRGNEPQPAPARQEAMLFFQSPPFAVVSVPELADICASLELLTDPMALGRIGVRSCKGCFSLFASSHFPRCLDLVAGAHRHGARRHLCEPDPVG
jgi:hypothetical protein